MIDPSKWPRYPDRAFYTNPFNTVISKAEKQVSFALCLQTLQAYVNYLDTVLVVQNWDKWPEFKDPESTRECKEAYFSRLE